MLMSEMMIDDFRARHPGLYVTRKCDYDFKEIVSSVIFRIKGDDDHDFCSAVHRDAWQEEEKEREKSKGKDMKKNKKKKRDEEDEDEIDETTDEDTDDEDEDDSDDSDEDDSDDEDDEDEDRKKKKKKKSGKDLKKKKKKSKKSDDDDDEDEDDEDDKKSKKKDKKKKKNSVPSRIAAAEYDPKTPIGKMWARLKENKGGIKKKVLYKGLGDDAHRLLAWIKIHGNRSGAWKIVSDDDKVKLVMKKKG